MWNIQEILESETNILLKHYHFWINSILQPEFYFTATWRWFSFFMPSHLLVLKRLKSSDGKWNVEDLQKLSEASTQEIHQHQQVVRLNSLRAAPFCPWRTGTEQAKINMNQLAELYQTSAINKSSSHGSFQLTSTSCSSETFKPKSICCSLGNRLSLQALEV